MEDCMESMQFLDSSPMIQNNVYIQDNAHSCIMRTLNFLIENRYMYPNKNVTSKNTELKQAMLKLNTFMLQH